MSTDAGTPTPSDTYPMPKHGWTCFHCGDTFTTPGSARDHFGPTIDCAAGCQIKAGEERGLLMTLRKAEAELTRYRAEDSDKDREFYAMRSAHSQALVQAEQKGYDSGLKDYMKLDAELTALRAAHEAAQAEIVERDDAWMRLDHQRKFELAVAQAEIAALREDAERWRISLKLKSFPVKLGSPLYLDGGYVKWTINGDHYGLTENECADAARRKP